MYSISLLCPTRKRMTGLSTMWQSALDTARNPKDLELVLYIDNDDIDTLNFAKTLGENVIILEQGDRSETYSNLHNICCSHSSADIVFTAADDIIFRSCNWDDVVINAFKLHQDKIMFLFPNDGHWGGKFGTHGFFHKNWYNTLGYLSPPIFTVGYSDNYINDIASSINRLYYMGDEVLIEHMHWTFKKSAFDQTAQEAHKKRFETNNDSIYRNEETLSRKNKDIQKLLEKITYE